MHPIKFPGAVPIQKPDDMTDEQCSSIYAFVAVDKQGFPFYLTAWQPAKEDLDAFNNGEPVYVKTICRQLPPMELFTTDVDKKLHTELNLSMVQLVGELQKAIAHAKECSEICDNSMRNFQAQDKFVSAAEMRMGYRCYTLFAEQLTTLLNGGSYAAAEPFKPVE